MTLSAKAEKVFQRIAEILKRGETVELHLEHGKLVIVKISRKAEKTDFIMKTE